MQVHFELYRLIYDMDWTGEGLLKGSVWKKYLSDRVYPRG